MLQNYFFTAVVVQLLMKIGYLVLGIAAQDLEMMEKLWLGLMIGIKMEINKLNSY